MGAAEIIAASVAAINLLNKSIEAANAGDLDAARRYLGDARDHFSGSVAAWDAAGKQE